MFALIKSMPHIGLVDVWRIIGQYYCELVRVPTFLGIPTVVLARDNLLFAQILAALRCLEPVYLNWDLTVKPVWITFPIDADGMTGTYRLDTIHRVTYIKVHVSPTWSPVLCVVHALFCVYVCIRVYIDMGNNMATYSLITQLRYELPDVWRVVGWFYNELVLEDPRPTFCGMPVVFGSRAPLCVPVRACNLLLRVIVKHADWASAADAACSRAVKPYQSCIVLWEPAGVNKHTYQVFIQFRDAVGSLYGNLFDNVVWYN
jgi:hypothetical protein